MGVAEGMNKNGILFLTPGWIPVPTAVSICTKGVAEELKDNGYNIYVSSLSEDGKTETVREDGMIIYRIMAPIDRCYFGAAELCKEKNRKHILYIIAQILSKCMRLLFFAWYPNPNPIFSHKWADSAIEIIEKYDIKTVVTLAAPMESLIAGRIIKQRKPDIKWIIYQIDNGSHEQRRKSVLVKKMLEAHGMKNVKKQYRFADKIILMKNHKVHYDNEYFDDVRDKFIYADVPLLNKMICSSNENICPVEMDPEYENWIYAGTISKPYYDPTELCSFFIRYADRKKARLHFFGTGDCVDTLDVYQKRTQGTIQYHGLVKRNELENIYKQADVLVYYKSRSIAGSISGKFFEYLAAEKPVVFFSTDINDINVNNVKKIPYGAVLVNNSTDEENFDEIQRVLGKSSDCSYAKAMKLFYDSTPQYAAKIIKETIK